MKRTRRSRGVTVPTRAIGDTLPAAAVGRRGGGPVRWLVAMCVWCAGSAAGAAPALGEPRGDAAGYRVELQVPASERALLEENLDLIRWRDDARMNEIQLRRLVRLVPSEIRALLETAGFYAPTVTATLDQRGNAWVVRLRVDPGEPVRVGTVEQQVIGAFNDGAAANRARLEDMRRQWRLPPGSVFRHDDWEAAKRQALAALLVDGYPAATIADSRATVAPATATAALHLTLDSGPAFTLGELDIHGLRRYPATIVTRLNPIVPGTAYSQRQLLNLQSRLQDSPYFANAVVSVDTDRERPSAVPVRVELQERPSRSFGLGIGASTDTGARGQVQYRDLDFLDRAWRLGGTLKLEQKRQSFVGELQLPLSRQHYQDGFSVLAERTDIQGELTRKLALEARRTVSRERFDTGYGLRYLDETQEIPGVRSTRSATLSPTFTFVRRATDDAINPTRGYLLDAEINAAARAVLSDQNFLRGYLRAVLFHPLGARDQLILRGELGAVVAPERDGIPSDFLFRTGGDQSVRGYSYQSLGVAEGSATVGGRFLVVASAEYVHWFTPQWGGAVFVDGGDAKDAASDLKPVYGYGIGARWKSPVGPLSLDLAYGQASKEVRLHFSVGFRF